MRKALGLVLFLGLIFAFFLFLRECRSSGGGNTPLSQNSRGLLNFVEGELKWV